MLHVVRLAAVMEAYFYASLCRASCTRHVPLAIMQATYELLIARLVHTDTKTQK